MPVPSISDAPAVSVIIPTFNRRYFLERALQSLARQTWLDFEAIVCDDGSQDDTAHLVEQWSGQSAFRLRYVYQERSGPARARNRGLALAQGEFVALLDSDDTYRPEKLAVQVEMMRQNPRAAFCYTGYCLMPEGRAIRPGSFDRTRFLRGNYLCCASVLMRRTAVAKAGGYVESLPVAEDWDLLLRLSRLGVVEGTDAPLYEYFAHRGQISRNQPQMHRYTELVHRQHGGAGRRPIGYMTSASQVYH